MLRCGLSQARRRKMSKCYRRWLAFQQILRLRKMRIVEPSLEARHDTLMTAQNTSRRGLEQSPQGESTVHT
jgi:hypothetical protein